MYDGRIWDHWALISYRDPLMVSSGVWKKCQQEMSPLTGFHTLESEAQEDENIFPGQVKQASVFFQNKFLAN